MTRNLKALGLALFAALALSAMAASAASAKHHFGAPKAPTDVTGSQGTQHIFTTEAGEVKCNTATFSGTQGSASTSEVTITPHYTGCTAFGFASTHVKFNGCDYTFTTPTVDITPGEFTSEPPHVLCPGTSVVEITPTIPFFGTSVCTVTVEPQTPTSGHVLYKNEGSGDTRDVLVTSKVEGIHYTVHGGGGTCGTTESGGKTITHTDGKYTGTVTLKGYEDGNHAVHEPILIETTS